MKTINEIVARIIENGSASINEELEIQFDFAASEEGYTDEQIEQAKKSPWFPWIKNPAAVALGSIKSERKAKTSAANGKLGGRPSKYDLDTTRRVRQIDKIAPPRADFILADWQEWAESGQ